MRVTRRDLFSDLIHPCVCHDCNKSHSCVNDSFTHVTCGIRSGWSSTVPPLRTFEISPSWIRHGMICHPCGWVTVWVMSHIWMIRITHIWTCHTYEWFMSHIWMSHGMSYVTHVEFRSEGSSVVPVLLRFAPFLALPRPVRVCICVRVCVWARAYVCVKERERQRERRRGGEGERENKNSSSGECHTWISHVTHVSLHAQSIIMSIIMSCTNASCYIFTHE